MDQEKIGKFIAQIRKEKNITQSDLAEKLGVTDRSVSNWENGKNMPDLSLFKPLCDELNISINEFLSGEKIKKGEYQEKFEENIINTIEYSSKKISEKNKNISILLIIFGLLISVIALTMFASESSFGAIFSILGVIIALIGFSIQSKKHPYHIRVILNFVFLTALLSILFTIDFLGVINIHQAPRFTINTITFDDTIYYNTPFYDVVRCNKNSDKEQEIEAAKIAMQKYFNGGLNEEKGPSKGI